MLGISRMSQRTMKGGAKVAKSQSSRRLRGIRHSVNKIRAATLRGNRNRMFSASASMLDEIKEKQGAEDAREASARAKFLKKGATLAELLRAKRSSSRSKKNVNRYVSAPSLSPSKSRSSKAIKKSSSVRRSAFGKDAFANMFSELEGIQERSNKYHAARAGKGKLPAVRENNANNEM